MTEFLEFRKIPRLTREVIITEKIDGTNGQIQILEDGTMLVGSRTRWITPEDDNHGFCRWCMENKEELLKLGAGSHFGEWWGAGIQRNYGVAEKRFSLFNTHKWSDDAVRPACCSVVPVISRGMFDTNEINAALEGLRQYGSKAAPGFTRPEGIIIYHTQGNLYFKKTLDKDEEYKGKQQ